MQFFNRALTVNIDYDLCFSEIFCIYSIKMFVDTLHTIDPNYVDISDSSRLLH
jgi:hypothetical protein